MGFFDYLTKNQQVDIDCNQAFIQVQSSGVWQTYTICPNDLQMIQLEMQQLARNHPGHRIRAVDKDGRVLDIL